MASYLETKTVLMLMYLVFRLWLILYDIGKSIIVLIYLIDAPHLRGLVYKIEMI